MGQSGFSRFDGHETGNGARGDNSVHAILDTGMINQAVARRTIADFGLRFVWQ